jgi:hypothetical protein
MGDAWMGESQIYLCHEIQIIERGGTASRRN